MVASAWGNLTAGDQPVTSIFGDESGPAVADSGGGSYGAAWASENGVVVRFYDVIGAPDPALGSFFLSTTGSGATYGGVALTSGGAGIGYGAAWQETDGSGATSLNLRYVGLSSPVGGVITIASGTAGPGLSVHDVALSGYAAVDGAFKPLKTIDGINVAWIATDTSVSTSLTADQIAAGYGAVMFQRYAVPLDAKRDPAGPPAAAGLDGAVGGVDDLAVQVAAVGRNVAVASDSHLGGVTVISWIDTNNVVHARFYSASGVPLTTASGAIGGGVDLDNLGTAADGQDVKIVSDGASFFLVWGADSDGDASTTEAIGGRVFAGGVTPNSFTGGSFQTFVPLATLPAGETYSGEFAVAPLIDSGGISIAVTAEDAGANVDIFLQQVAADGSLVGTPDLANSTTAGNQTQVGMASLAGDRLVLVYQDDPSAAPGDANIRSQILDTRTSGQILVGSDTATKTVADMLVGTVGDDIIRGLADNDTLYGAMGDDLIVGGAGDDVIDGGGNSDAGDVAVFSGSVSDYEVTYLGGSLFSVKDLRSGSPDGTDVVSNVEFFRFNGEGGANLEAAGFIPFGPGVTPTPWGESNRDGDLAPDLDGAPDQDGMLVNHAASSRAGIQGNPAIADRVGEFIGILWETAAADGADTHIRGQFYDVVLGPDAFIPNAIDISDGVGIEFNPVIATGGANSGWSVAWEQRDNAADDTREIRHNFVGPSALTSVELSVADEGPNVDQHDAAIFGSFLDRTLSDPVGGSALPASMNDGYNIAWVSTDLDPVTRAPTDAVGDGAYGRIMWQRFEVPLDALRNPGAPLAGGVDGIAGLGSDDPVWIGTEGGAATGAMGRNPSTTALHGFESIVIWIEQDGVGGERVAGRVYDDLGQVVNVPGFDDISAGFPVVPGTKAHVVSAGAVNFGVAWITGDAASGYQIVGTMYAPAGAGLNGTGFGFAAPAPYVFQTLPAGIDIDNIELSLSGLSGENSNDLVVAWRELDPSGGADIMARHIAVALDPVTGQVIDMRQEGDAIQVNADSAGNQDHNAIAGLLGDRFISVWHDDNGSYTDGSDIVARVIDTRAPGQIITGDIYRAGSPVARRDILVGTVGDDIIRGDISDADGLTDTIYAGMGNDVIMGGPGLRGAAGIPELIYGGEGDHDTAVYTGRIEDYSITLNGDGSIEVIDLRPTVDGNGDPLQNDGVDNLFDIEHLRFLNLTQSPALGVPTNWSVSAPAWTEIDLSLPGSPPPPAADYNGDPVPWSLTDTSQFKTISVDASPGLQSEVAVTNLQTDAAMAWVSGGDQVWAIRHQIQGNPDPLFSLTPVQLTDGSAVGATVSDLFIAMTGGLGFTAAWESTVGGDSEIHLRFGSTNTHVVLDQGAGVPGSGLAGGEITVVGSDDASGTAVDPVVGGYEIVNGANDTIEFGFHVGYVLKADAAATYGTIQLARYEIPVYDVMVDPVTGQPVLDAGGQGQLAVDAFGNLVPSADLSKGSESAPISIGLDGLRGTADDAASIVLTNVGLFAANDPIVGTDADHSAIEGRDLSLATLHSGQLVVTYIGTDEQVHLRIFVPNVDQAGDRETGGVGTDVVVTGITQYSELALPFATTVGSIASTMQTQYVVPQQNGSFGIFWAEGSGATVAIKGIIYSGAGTAWSPSAVLTFATGLAPTTNFHVSPTGVTPGGLEDGFFLSWEADGDVFGQRFDMTGAAVGSQIVIDDPSLTPEATHSYHSAAGLDDGRILIGYQDANGDIAAQYLDTRQPGVPLIGPRTGAGRDVIVGTVGDDVMDGRALDDAMYGGLGNDFITLGTDADIGDGGDGDDTIIGGVGQDQLLGGAGNDLLWGGPNGPIDPKADGALIDGLNAELAIANANGLSTNGLTSAQLAALIASDDGADIISGGDGIDTLSFQGEFGDFIVDLSTGVVESDRDGDGVFGLEDVVGQIVDDGAGGAVFHFLTDIENATGGYGDDTLLGNAQNNVFDGGTGENIIDGGGQTGGQGDILILHGNFADFSFAYDEATKTFTFTDLAAGAGLATVHHATDIETFRFDDGDIAASVLSNKPASGLFDVATDVSGAQPALIAKALKLTDPDNVSLANPTGIVTTAVSLHWQVSTDDGATWSAAGTGATFDLSDLLVGRVRIVAEFLDDLGNSEIVTSQSWNVIVGDAGANPVDGSANPAQVDLLFGQAGNDLINGHAGNDVLVGGGGNDIIDGGAGIDTSRFAGTIETTVFALAADGALLVTNGQIGTDTIRGVERFGFGGLDYTIVIGSNGGDNLHAAVGGLPSLILGFDGDDILTGGHDNDLLAGGAGHDRFMAAVGDGSDKIVGGAGIDTYDCTAIGTRVTIDLLNHSASGTQIGSDQIFGVENATGGSGNDSISGTDGANLLIGGSGNDVLIGLGGDDVLIGGTGRDILDGGAGTDTVSYAGAATAVTVNLSRQDAPQNTVGDGTDTLKSIENLIGSALGDLLLGSATANRIDGGLGNDRIAGGQGDDTLIGGAGVDTLLGGLGADRLEGGDGADLLDGGLGADTMVGGLGDDVYTVDSTTDKVIEAAGGGTDLIRSVGANVVLTNTSEVENVTLVNGNANITGNDLDNRLTGSNGANVLDGRNGNDALRAGGGADTLIGGLGNDMLYGGDGKDVLTGGAGLDRFVFGALTESSTGPVFADRITDFSQVEHDHIVLNLIDAIAGGSDDAFIFIGNTVFSQTAGELRYVFSGGDTLVQMDVDGDGHADMTVVLTGEIALTSGDFVL